MSDELPRPRIKYTKTVFNRGSMVSISLTDLTSLEERCDALEADLRVERDTHKVVVQERLRDYTAAELEAMVTSHPRFKRMEAEKEALRADTLLHAVTRRRMVIFGIDPKTQKPIHDPPADKADYFVFSTVAAVHALYVVFPQEVGESLMLQLPVPGAGIVTYYFTVARDRRDTADYFEVEISSDVYPMPLRTIMRKEDVISGLSTPEGFRHKPKVEGPASMAVFTCHRVGTDDGGIPDALDRAIVLVQTANKVREANSRRIAQARVEPAPAASRQIGSGQPNAMTPQRQ